MKGMLLIAMIMVMIAVIVIIIFESVELIKEKSYTWIAKTVIILTTLPVIQYCFNIAFNIAEKIPEGCSIINYAICEILMNMAILTPHLAFIVMKSIYTAMKGSRKNEH